MKKRFLLPWEKKHAITCTECGGKIETRPLWHWQKQDDAIRALQPGFCHRIDSMLIGQIPVLTENDWKSKLKFDEFLKEFEDEYGRARPYEAVKHLFVADEGPPEIFLKHGIFPLLRFLTERELEALYLLLCLEPGNAVKQVFARA